MHDSLFSLPSDAYKVTSDDCYTPRWVIGTGAGNEGFARPDGTFMRPRFPVFVAFRGVGTVPAERLAASDPYGATLYGKAAA